MEAIVICINFIAISRTGEKGKMALKNFPSLIFYRKNTCENAKLSPKTARKSLKSPFSVPGRCEDGNPCSQNCYNIHNEMYECDCNKGFKLSPNGYSCLGKRGCVTLARKCSDQAGQCWAGKNVLQGRNFALKAGLVQWCVYKNCPLLVLLFPAGEKHGRQYIGQV